MPNRRRFLTHESFARLVAIETDECVLWPHGVSSRGYGLLEMSDANGDTYRVPAGHIAFVSDGTNLALIISENGIA